MSERFDLCIIGGGSGGLSVAAGAAQMGAKVVLVERGRMGGDCLNTGCVPSKALIAAAQRAQSIRDSDGFGISGAPPNVLFDNVHDHVHAVIAAIAPHDSVERFAGLGVRVIPAEGRFVRPDMLIAGDVLVRARRFVVATGSRPVIPPIPGLDQFGYLTNETVFELRERPDHLLVVGGGPIGVELAQAFRRLGSGVTLIERFGILPRDEPEAVEIVRDVLLKEGVRLLENAEISAVVRVNGKAEVMVRTAGETQRLIGSHILVAAGRKPDVDSINPAAAKIEVGPAGIKVDARLRTSNKRIFAIGDVCGGPQFTHIAGYQAGIVIRNALFSLPAKVNYNALPWVTYTEPELAHVGLTEAQARSDGHTVSVLIEPLHANDRAQAERATDGIAKIVVGSRGRILGATLVTPHAGELIGLWGLAIAQGLKLSAIAGMIAPYPTLSEISKRAAGRHFTPTLYGDRMRTVARLIQRLLP
ncbi:dihydrolipoyl dehydrogenase family protein [Pseudorhodoplanes sp.]|uniref:dihydrolipoyl dehydrogenase family protein n=1 Tax=Pseudorhodoplanes sp. TaxID=1934341 RepID=UPI003D11F779